MEYVHSKTTPVGFEPTRGDPIGLAGRRLDHSAKVSSAEIDQLTSHVPRSHELHFPGRDRHIFILGQHAFLCCLPSMLLKRESEAH